MRRFLPALIVLQSARLLAWPGYHQDFHYSYNVPSDVHISLEGFNGSVEVFGWDEKRVDVSGTKHAESQEQLDQLKIEVRQEGNRLDVGTTGSSFHHGNMGVRFVLRVPKGCTLERVNSSNGGIRVEEVTGAVEVSTSNGPLNLSRIGQRVRAHTSNGSIELEEIGGAIEAVTSNAGVHARRVHDGVRLHTSNGGIHVELAEVRSGEPIELETSNGGVDLSLAQKIRNDVVVRTSNGGITLRVPDGMGARIHAVTSGHDSITSELELKVNGTISRSRLDGVLGEGGPSIRLETSNASIHLRRA